MAESLDGLADRPGWSLAGSVASYAPVARGWIARVRPLRLPGRSRDRFHIAVVDERGVARYTFIASTVAEARRIAEANVDGRG